MLYSMTGFGRGEHADGEMRARVEIRSVNHRNLDTRLSLPSALASHEVEVLRFLRERIGRGRVEVRVELDGLGRQGALLDVKSATQVHRRLQNMAASLGIQDEVSLSHVLSAPGLWQTRHAEADEAVFGTVMLALSEAIDGLSASRLQEGEALRKDLLQYVERFRVQLSSVSDRAPARIDEYRERLQSRIDELTEGIEVDPQRLATEVALFADRVDVAEELSRAAAHLDAIGGLLDDSDRPATERIGKRLDFFLQELNREINTMGSKSRDAALTASTIDMKTILESMREQAANAQ